MILILNKFDLNRSAANKMTTELEAIDFNVSSSKNVDMIFRADTILFHDIDKDMFKVIKCRHDIDGINKPVNKHQLGMILDYILLTK